MIPEPAHMEKTENVQSHYNTSDVPTVDVAKHDDKQCSEAQVEIETAANNVELQTNGDYPDPYQLNFILIALILSMFLVGH
jgi:ribosome-associated translation inhibitor RaiA